MKKFLDWAFYGQVPDNLEMNAIYESYKIYCVLFKIEPMKKFEFIEEFINEY